MANPISMQHILTNSSSAEKIQQSNHTQADGQQKHFAAKFQEEKRTQEHKAPPVEKSNRARIKKEGERQKKQDLLPKRKKKDPGEKSMKNQEEQAPRIDVIV